ncbi:MAG TPA: hypothetical protein VN081_06010 [Dongiaceae bacterium]|nr:hypothetical protein [Dongiaceae bacterium]
MKERLRAIIGMLITIFVLGMAVNLLGAPDSGASVAHNILSGIILLLHVLTAVGIVVVSAQLLYRTRGQKGRQRNHLAWGFGAVCFAFLAGVTTTAIPSPWSDFASFLMALGFMAALILYGAVLLRNAAAK